MSDKQIMSEITQADYDRADGHRQQHGLNSINRDHLAATLAAHRIASSPAGDAELRKAAEEAVTLIDEINKRSTYRAFYRIDQTLHAKLETIRATLAIPLATPPVQDQKGVER